MYPLDFSGESVFSYALPYSTDLCRLACIHQNYSGMLHETPLWSVSLREPPPVNNPFSLTASFFVDMDALMVPKSVWATEHHPADLAAMLEGFRPSTTESCYRNRG